MITNREIRISLGDGIEDESMDASDELVDAIDFIEDYYEELTDDDIDLSPTSLKRRETAFVKSWAESWFWNDLEEAICSGKILEAI